MGAFSETWFSSHQFILNATPQLPMHLSGEARQSSNCFSSKLSAIMHENEMSKPKGFRRSVYRDSVKCAALVQASGRV